jgi:hypothetical protein
MLKAELDRDRYPSEQVVKPREKPMSASHLAPEFELTPQREQRATMFLTEVISLLPFNPQEQALLVQELPQMTPSMWQYLLELLHETLAQMPGAGGAGKVGITSETAPQWRMTGVPGGPEGEGVEPEPPKD